MSGVQHAAAIAEAERQARGRRVWQRGERSMGLRKGSRWWKQIEHEFAKSIQGRYNDIRAMDTV